MSATDPPQQAREKLGAAALSPAALGVPSASPHSPPGVCRRLARWSGAGGSSCVTRSVATFDRQQADARWTSIWLSLLPLALIGALGVAYALYGPDAAAGYSSLPVGPKLHLPPTPLLPLAAFVGSIAQFFLFVGVLQLSASRRWAWHLQDPGISHRAFLGAADAGLRHH